MGRRPGFFHAHQQKIHQLIKREPTTLMAADEDNGFSTRSTQPYPQPYPQPWLSITARYLGSDGIVPESITIELANPVGLDEPIGGAIEAVIEKLASVARNRRGHYLAAAAAATQSGRCPCL